MKKAKLTAAVRPLGLPKGKDRVRPGQVCRVAGWGQMATGRYPDTLQEVELIMQEDQECKSRFPNYYNHKTQLCVGDPKEKKSSFQVSNGSKRSAPPEGGIGSTLPHAGAPMLENRAPWACSGEKNRGLLIAGTHLGYWAPPPC